METDARVVAGDACSRGRSGSGSCSCVVGVGTGGGKDDSSNTIPSNTTLRFWRANAHRTPSRYDAYSEHKARRRSNGSSTRPVHRRRDVSLRDDPAAIAASAAFTTLAFPASDGSGCASATSRSSTTRTRIRHSNSGTGVGGRYNAHIHTHDHHHHDESPTDTGSGKRDRCVRLSVPPPGGSSRGRGRTAARAGDRPWPSSVARAFPENGCIPPTRTRL